MVSKRMLVSASISKLPDLAARADVCWHAGTTDDVREFLRVTTIISNTMIEARKLLAMDLMQELESEVKD